MANARLHIICGNCGCSDLLTHRIRQDIDDETGEEYQSVSIDCNNCHTVHQLEDNAKLEKR
jgi:uncharacterized Zn finger protein